MPDEVQIFELPDRTQKWVKLFRKKIKTRMLFFKKNLSSVPIIEVTKIKN